MIIQPLEKCENYDFCEGFCETIIEVNTGLCENCLDEKDLFDRCNRLEAQVIELSNKNKELRENCIVKKYLLDTVNRLEAQVMELSNQNKELREAIDAAMKGGA